MSVRSVSYGGGVQSTALLVLAAQQRIDFDLFLFANVGDDSEHPDSLRYVQEIAKPYAAAHGIELLELHRVPMRGRMVVACSGAGTVLVDKSHGDAEATIAGYCGVCGRRFTVPSGDRLVPPPHNQPETLWGRLMHPDSRSLPIPVRMSNGAPGTRSCTADFKIRVVGKELQRRGATVDAPAVVALGISLDEIERATPGVDPRAPYQFRTYPLLDLGMSRTDCKRIIGEAGLPVPGKSACFFCPFHDKEAWRALKRDTPDLWEKSCELEDTLNERRRMLGKDEVYLTRHGIPLRDTLDDQLVLDGMDGCDSGWCMT